MTTEVADPPQRISPLGIVLIELLKLFNTPKQGDEIVLVIASVDADISEDLFDTLSDMVCGCPKITKEDRKRSV